jgi:outer membrane murein-binding lipoprotein Lpp
MLDGLFINSSSVTGTPIRLNNNQFLRSRNAADTGDINVLKVNSSNQIEFSIVPIVTGLGSLALLSDITDYSAAIATLQGEVAGLQSDIAAVQGQIVIIETDLTSIEESIGFLQSDVNILNTSVNTLVNDVNALEALQSLYVLLDGTRAMTGALNLGNHKIINVTNPTLPQDAATKAYVDAAASDISALEARVTALETDVSTLQLDVGVLQTDVSSLQAQILSLNVTVSDLQDEDLTFLKIDGSRAMTGILDLGSHKIINVVDPTDPQDVATKAYVDASGPGAYTASNLGAGENVYAQQVANDFQFKTLVAGTNISLTADADTITVNSTGSGIAGIDVLVLGVPFLSDVTTINFQSGLSVSSGGPGEINLEVAIPPFPVISGSGSVTVTQFPSGNYDIYGPPPGEINTASNLGAGEGIYSAKVGTDLQFKSLIAGSNIGITSDADTITINATGLSSPVEIFKDGVPVVITSQLNFTGTNITVNDVAGVAEISVSGGGGTSFDYIQFNLTPVSVPADPGTLFWDQADGNQTLSLNMVGGNVVQQIGEEEYVRIKATAAILQGQSVMITGTVGTSGAYEGQPAQGVTDGHVILGVATEDIAFNDYGYITCMGLVRNIVTDGSPYLEVWNDGDDLYWNPDPLYPGGLTNVKPSAPNVKAYIGSVVKASNGSSGSIYVRLNPGSELGGTDSNVEFGILDNYDFIVYDAGLGYWKNITLAETQGIIGSGGGGSYADIEIPLSLDIDWQSATTYHLAISANTTFTFSNLVAGKTITVIIENTSGLAVNAVFPTTIAQDGLDEIVFANSFSVYTFIYSNGNIYATVAYNMV